MRLTLFELIINHKKEGDKITTISNHFVTCVFSWYWGFGDLHLFCRKPDWLLSAQIFTTSWKFPIQTKLLSRATSHFADTGILQRKGTTCFRLKPNPWQIVKTTEIINLNYQILVSHICVTKKVDETTLSIKFSK